MQNPTPTTAKGKGRVVNKEMAEKETLSLHESRRRKTHARKKGKSTVASNPLPALPTLVESVVEVREFLKHHVRAIKAVRATQTSLTTRQVALLEAAESSFHAASKVAAVVASDLYDPSTSEGEASDTDR
jgi:hypothetical protein